MAVFARHRLPGPGFPVPSRSGRLSVALGLAVGFVSAQAAEKDKVEFDRDIRPLLSENCLFCHGPDANERKADLRLDQEESAKANRDGHFVIVPGHPEKSEIIARITNEDEDERMPPPKSNKSLTAEEIELIRTWIEQGAPWQKLWSLIPPTRPELPEVQGKSWPRNPIDYFILARLEKEGLAPSKGADKTTLIRRVTFDLTGLPPTPEEVDAFLADGSSNAYEKVVDRLLHSPRYGEHRARYWLDAVRYGDTHGLHLDNYREMWPYRDWVVNAFNENKPFDRFVIEQLAGDLLPDPTPEEMVATGFNRCNVTTNEGGSIEEEVYVRNVVDRVDTVGTVFMGLTLECTRCHDHKFDPLTMKDFYSMFAYFNSLDGPPMDGNRKDPAPVVRAPSDSQREQLALYDRKIAEIEERLRAPWPQIDELQLAWEKKLRNAASDADSDSADDPDYLVLGDWYTVGPFTEDCRYIKNRKPGPEGKPVHLDDQFEINTGETLQWKRRGDWADGEPHQDLPGDIAANFVYRKIQATKAQKITVSLGSDDAIKVYLNEKEVLFKDVERGVAPDQDSLDLNLQEGENHLLIKIINYGGASGYYFALKSGQITIPEEISDIISNASDERTPEQSEKLRGYFRNKVSDDETLTRLKDQLEKLRMARADLDRLIPTTLVWRERKDPRPAYVLKRGEYDHRGEEVSRRTPSTLPPMSPDLPNDRLGLAEWLVDPLHPLTARVTVNRFWQQLFGTGIVKTAEDFGSQGEPPSHPELLDWLAVEFIESGWDVKAMMKKMVMSATYRQSSNVTPELHKRDPENRLLARGPRFRLDAEMLRDQALYVSGLLVEKMGGPSVKPPQPDGLWFAVGYSGSNTVRFVPDEGEDKVHRRTLYTFIKRTAPPPQLSTFDAPSRESSCVRRERTNTPLQALLLFNDPQYVEAARALAERTMREAEGDDDACATYMFRLCASRYPSQLEVDELVQGYREDLATYQQDMEAANKLIAVGKRPPDETLDPSELAAWTMTANLLLNLDEVITKN